MSAVASADVAGIGVVRKLLMGVGMSKLQAIRAQSGGSSWLSPLGCAVGVFLLANTSSRAIELAQNGGFELWDPFYTAPEDWSLTGTYSGAAFNEQGDPVHGGSLAVKSFDSDNPGTVSQILNGTSSAQLYKIEFWLKNGDGTDDGEPSSPNSVFVDFGTKTLLNVTDMPLSGWVRYSFQEYGLNGSTPLLFEFLNGSTWFFLDDVSVTEVTTVPDAGATAGLMAFAALGLAGLSPWRRRA